jgi:hypothetical protein
MIAFVVAALLVLPSMYTYDEFPRSPYRSAAQDLHPRILHNDIVLHDNKLSYFPMHYSASSVPQAFLPDEPGSHNDTLAPATQASMNMWPVEGLKAATQDASRVWFVYFTRAVQEWEELGSNHPALEALKQDWEELHSYTFNDLEIVLFEQ